MKYDELCSGHEGLSVSIQRYDRLFMNSNLPPGKNYRRKINAPSRARQRRITFFSPSCADRMCRIKDRMRCFSFGLHMEMKHPRVLPCLATKMPFLAAISRSAERTRLSLQEPLSSGPFCLESFCRWSITCIVLLVRRVCATWYEKIFGKLTWMLTFQPIDRELSRECSEEKHPQCMGCKMVTLKLKCSTFWTIL